MISLSVSDLANAVNGEITRCDFNENKLLTQIITDSRTIINGENAVFFALVGPRNNGHGYIEELLSKNVRVFVVSQSITIPPEAEAAIIKTGNTLSALQQLAAVHRSSFNCQVIGITGSNGKTIVKEWLHDLLSQSFWIVRSPKSYNSQTGVPLSVLLMQPGNNLGIFEAGISQPGEMEKLAHIINPSIGIFTNIGDAHQENFKNVEEKIYEKLKLFDLSGKLIFNCDAPVYSGIIADFCTKKNIEAISWSMAGNKAMIQFHPSSRNGNTKISARWNNIEKVFSIPFSDHSSIENACHCFAAIFALNIVQDSVIEKFSQLTTVAMRLELKKGINNCLLVNDYYNSDINSLEIALSVLNMQAEKNHLEKIVVLSDIKQSGLSESELYFRVNELLASAGIVKLAGVGPAIRKAGQLFSMKTAFYETTHSFIADFNARNYSQAAILIKGAREFRFEDVSAVMQKKSHQSILEINMNALVKNLNIFHSQLKPGTRLMVMVKAFSYGSGDVEIAKLLQFQRVDYLAVAVADEGVELRNAGISIPIIVMNPEWHSFQLLIDYQLEPNLFALELAEEFSRVADHNALQNFPVHLKIDTGMNRLGFKTPLEIDQLIGFLRKQNQIRVVSVFSHLAASDDPLMDSFTLEQIALFEQLSNKIIDELGYPVMRHILNSAGIERFPQWQYEMVRLGIGLYGVSCAGIPLAPISLLKSTISQVKTVNTNETIGYNRAGQVKKNSVIAIIPLGYADGLDRRLGNNKGNVYINGKFAPIIGNICMDMCMVDVTGLDVQAGDEVEFFGEHITVQDIAAVAETIPYEILTGISQRVKRVYLQE